ncbi:shikimate kinase [Candidatus Pyrohabitans sp.]
MKKNLVLTGFMGAGKSTIGRAAAEKLGLRFIDTDEEIEKRAGMKISEIFQKYGEAYFRELERQVVEEVSELEGCVIVTGGGVVLNEENISNLRRKGVVVYLHAEPEVVYQRLRGDTSRPLLRVAQPLARIRELLKQRSSYYANHDYSVDTSKLSVEEVVEEVVRIYTRACKQG